MKAISQQLYTYIKMKLRSHVPKTFHKKEFWALLMFLSLENVVLLVSIMRLMRVIFQGNLRWSVY
jgi:hypothetical protein